ncbi:MAG: T9SS type A sorting domain-containing protein, partial [Ginsengibacter sp.]
ALLIYPNPAYTDLTLQVITGGQNEKVTVDIIDNSGKVVIRRMFVLPAGQNYVSFEGIDKLPASTYIVRVKSPTVNEVEKLVVGKK